MPELPEVEHIVRALDQIWVGNRIMAVSVRSPLLMYGDTAEDFAGQVIGKRVREVNRRGKFIIVRLSNNMVMLMHLRMTGQLIYASPEAQFDSFVRAVFVSEDGSQLAFHDRRHLGRIRLVRYRNLQGQAELKKLGEEPLGEGFTADRLSQLLSRSRRSIKDFLLDQTRVAGLGNIYASEALFRAGVNPRMQCSRLSRSPRLVHRLHRAIMKTLQAAIAAQGTRPTSMDFIGIDPLANCPRRKLRERFFVYDREGKPCRRCRGKIFRIKQGNRSTYFCRVCQP